MSFFGDMGGGPGSEHGVKGCRQGWRGEGLVRAATTQALSRALCLLSSNLIDPAGLRKLFKSIKSRQGVGVFASVGGLAYFGASGIAVLAILVDSRYLSS